ncbi:octaprenyl-diphosphate synthase [Helicobacter sp. MIT 00-7814]|uniref:polyprenyl synthetase family protein n=1 Tax=unclassified Helicobacter TaxID=2593540 RepID=UPI000E1ECAEA|nr:MULTISPECIES: polyprenyl synthetase family protein [unclassified Helicobacter]RDU53729.1 octaprenyl-diphosphate synthase [Helicobacter sp. MIT 99-10781]RDU54115.1 octaprenyl-diphosphate synthase [Helicobacter sp. MIT 00-7814]
MDFTQAKEKITQTMQTMIGACENDIINELFSHLQSGKMLRSKLVFAILEKLDCARANEAETSLSSKSSAHLLDSAITLCAIIELIQSASLLHDDVIDNATTRRAKPSLNARFGNKNAIMLGDVLYAKAFYELSKFPPQIAQSLSESVVRLSIGEIEDVFMAQNFNENLTRYLQMCEYKTAWLIAASAECAALLAGLEQRECAQFREYGRNLGIAFQIIDDILDVTQSAEVLGKPSMSDFSEGKSTLPFIYLFSRAPDSTKQELLGLFKKELDSTQIAWLKESFTRYECIKDSITLAKSYAKKALDSIKDKNNPTLESLAKSMIEREF